MGWSFCVPDWFQIDFPYRIAASQDFFPPIIYIINHGIIWVGGEFKDLIPGRATFHYPTLLQVPLDTHRGAAHSSHFVYLYFYRNIVQLQSHHGMNPAHLSHPSPGAERAGNKKDLGSDLLRVKQKVILWAPLSSDVL